MDDGGPAFPIASDLLGHGCGMSLRDWFAEQALAGSIAWEWEQPAKMAKEAYEFADAMILERAKEKP